MKIIDTLPAPKRKEIQTIGTQVNAAFLAANATASRAVEQYLEVGRLLTQARVYFAGDNEFGKWRAENTTVSKSWAGKLMKAHKAYPVAPPDGLGISALTEVAGASPELKDEVEKAAADPDTKTPSVREIRAAVKEEKPEPPMPEAMKERLAKEVKVLSPEELCQFELEKDYPERMKHWLSLKKPHVEDAMVLLGLPPFFDGRPNMETVKLIAHALMYDTEHPAVMMIREEFYGEV